MTWIEALEALASHPHVWRLRQLCDEAHSDKIQRDAYRQLVIRMASEKPPLSHPQHSVLDTTVALVRPVAAKGCGCGPPSLATQARGAAAAAGRWVASGFRLARPETQAARLAICRACPERDQHRDPRLDRCKICKCFLVAKLRLPTEKCPVDRWPVEAEVGEAKPGP